jgi:Tfp pilus assembly protein PilN
MPAFKKDINLLPKSDLSQNLGGRVLLWSITVGRYLIILTELVVMIVFFSRFKYDMDLANVRDEIKEKQQMIASFQDLEKQFRFLQYRVNIVKNIDEKNVLVTKVHQELSKTTPVDIYYQSVNISDNKLSVQGLALSDAGLVTLLAAIRDNDSFTNASLDSLTTKGERDPQLQFTLTADVVVK